ncbi:MAG: hypothetical protein QM765_29700 [Myxococcales bacterium]
MSKGRFGSATMAEKDWTKRLPALRAPQYGQRSGNSESGTTESIK